MAIYGTIFASTDAEIKALAPSWPQARDTVRFREGTNPFTKAAMMVPTWAPDGCEPVPGMDYVAELRRETWQIVPPLCRPSGEFADYQRYLEERTPAGLRGLPHAAVKNLISLEGVVRAMGLEWSDRPAYVSPAGQPLEELPASAVGELAKMATDELSELSGKWAGNDDLHPDLDQNGARWLLERICAVCRAAVGSERRVLLLVEA